MLLLSIVLLWEIKHLEALDSTGCPQGSCASPGNWNIQYNSFLNLEYSVHTKSIAFADDFLLIINGKSPLELEIYANIELRKV